MVGQDQEAQKKKGYKWFDAFYDHSISTYSDSETEELSGMILDKYPEGGGFLTMEEWTIILMHTCLCLH